MDSSGFMHKYYDWSAFETFVKELFQNDGDATVQHNVTEVDRYGAKRQIDVKIVRRSRFSRFTTLVECKRWREPIGRDRVDVLASSIEALSANDGAIFTTTGFEDGAIAYAKGKGIGLFLVRDLTPAEWGAPGRHVSFYLHVNAAEFRDMQFGGQAIALVDPPLPDGTLKLDVNPDQALDPGFDLFSVKTGERGPNLVSLLGDAHGVLLNAVGKAVGIVESGRNLTLELAPRGEVDLTGTEFRQLRLPQFALRLERIGFVFRTHVSQSLFEFDRGRNLDFAVMVESYVTDQRIIAQRRSGGKDIQFESASSVSDATATDTLKNGSLLRVGCSPWLGLGDKKPDRNGVIPQLLRVTVETEGRKPRLALLALPTPASCESAGSASNL